VRLKTIPDNVQGVNKQSLNKLLRTVHRKCLLRTPQIMLNNGKGSPNSITKVNIHYINYAYYKHAVQLNIINVIDLG